MDPNPIAPQLNQQKMDAPAEIRPLLGRTRKDAQTQRDPFHDNLLAYLRSQLLLFAIERRSRKRSSGTRPRLELSGVVDKVGIIAEQLLPEEEIGVIPKYRVCVLRME